MRFLALMMKKFNQKIIVIAVAMCVMTALFCCCSLHEERKYYSQKENYISVTGTISSIKYNDDATALYLNFSELTPELDDTCFKIIGDNLQMVQSQKIDTKLEIGTQIKFITAPKYFGDGYVMPIVAISINEESLLDFEDGYKNFTDWLSK